MSCWQEVFYNLHLYYQMGELLFSFVKKNIWNVNFGIKRMSEQRISMQIIPTDSNVAFSHKKYKLLNLSFTNSWKCTKK